MPNTASLPNIGNVRPLFYRNLIGDNPHSHLHFRLDPKPEELRGHDAEVPHVECVPALDHELAGSNRHLELRLKGTRPAAHGDFAAPAAAPLTQHGHALDRPLDRRMAPGVDPPHHLDVPQVVP